MANPARMPIYAACASSCVGRELCRFAYFFWRAAALISAARMTGGDQPRQALGFPSESFGNSL